MRNIASKIYLGIGFGILLIYLTGTAVRGLRSKPVLRPLSFGATKIEKGKYVPYTPSTSSSGSSSDSSGSGSKRSSYPSSGGYGGGK